MKRWKDTHKMERNKSGTFNVEVVYSHTHPHTGNLRFILYFALIRKCHKNLVYSFLFSSFHSLRYFLLFAIDFIIIIVIVRWNCSGSMAIDSACRMSLNWLPDDDWSQERKYFRFFFCFEPLIKSDLNMNRFWSANIFFVSILVARVCCRYRLVFVVVIILILFSCLNAKKKARLDFCLMYDHFHARAVISTILFNGLFYSVFLYFCLCLNCPNDVFIDGSLTYTQAFICSANKSTYNWRKYRILWRRVFALISLSLHPIISISLLSLFFDFNFSLFFLPFAHSSVHSLRILNVAHFSIDRMMMTTRRKISSPLFSFIIWDQEYISHCQIHTHIEIRPKDKANCERKTDVVYFVFKIRTLEIRRFLLCLCGTFFCLCATHGIFEMHAIDHSKLMESNST